METKRVLSTAFAVSACIIAACSPDAAPPVAPESPLNRQIPWGAHAGQPEKPYTEDVVDPYADPYAAPSYPRPIDDFVLNQGTYCVDDMNGGCMLYAPPVQNYMAWFDQKTGRAITVDYAGIANNWLRMNSGGQRDLGTQVNGTVTEQKLPDGRARVTVDLIADNAMSFAVNGPTLTTVPMFGYNVPELLDPNHAPSFGHSHLRLVFINQAPGMLLPDLNQLITAPQPGQELLELEFKYDGHGALRDQPATLAHVNVHANLPFTQAFPKDQSVSPMGEAFVDITW